jgi:tetratricopeptide (TPR) repeat protein
MGGKIFINYRRDDSIGMAGRLHDRLAHTFGRAKLFMDVDHIPAGTDFVAHLNSQVAACDVILVVIGPNWLGIKDESGGRRLDNPDDFVAIEIAAALARNIRVIPVLVDGARMPKASELPDSLKPLARRQAIDVRHAHFGHDAEALVAKMREALGDDAAGPRRWRVRAAIGAAAVAVLLLIGWGGYAFIQQMLTTVEQTVQRREAELTAELERQARGVTEAEAKRKAEEAEQQRVAAAKAEEERQAKAAAEAEEERKAEEERQAKAAAELEENRKADEARARYAFLVSQGDTILKSGDYDRAIADFDEAMRLDPTNAVAFAGRGLAYENKGNHDRAIADFNEAIRLDPTYAVAFALRGLAYENKGNHDRAIADINEAIRLNPTNAVALAVRGIAYENKGDYDRAIADFNEAIRLDPMFAFAFCNRGIAKLKIKDSRGNADIAKARQLNPSGCR